MRIVIILIQVIIRQPKFHEVANAVGAAIASVSGGVDIIEISEGKSLPDTLARIKQQAIDNAVKSGADRATTRIAEVKILPVQVLILLVLTCMVPNWLLFLFSM